MPSMIFSEDNRNEKEYGLYGVKRSDGSTHIGGDIDTTGDPTGSSTIGGFVEFSGSVPKSSADPYTWQWGNHVRIFENQNSAVRNVGTRRHTFAHNERNLVRTGDTVVAGQDILIMGKTGNAAYDSQAEHVHYQVDEWNGSRWVPQNPYPYAGIPNEVGSWINPDSGQSLTPGDKPSKEASSYACDISYHQTSFDACKMKSEGIDAVLLRATYGAGNDGKFFDYAAAATSAGLLLGAYMFPTWQYRANAASYTDAEKLMEEQTRFFIESLDKVSITSFVALDFEYEQGAAPASGITSRQYAELCNKSMAMMGKAGYTPLFYSYLSKLFDELGVENIQYPLWLAYYPYAGANDFAERDGSFPAGNWGARMQAVKDRVYLWQFSSEGYADKYGCAHGSNGIDKNYCYVNMNTGEQPPQAEEKGVQKLKVLDVFAGATAYKNGSGKAFNVQGFSSPDVNDVAMDHIPDGRYWVNEYNVRLANSDLSGVLIQYGSSQLYVALLDGATEITEMPNAEAYQRFVMAG